MMKASVIFYRACLLVFSMLYVVSPAVAAVQQLEAEHVYHMGDSESRSEAVNMCYKEASRKAVEAAGVYMESVSASNNLVLEKDEIRSMTAAVVKIERLEETVELEGQHLSVLCKAKVSLDSEEMLATLQRMANDPQYRKQISGNTSSADGANDSTDSDTEFSGDAMQPRYAPPPPRPQNGRKPPKVAGNKRPRASNDGQKMNPAERMRRLHKIRKSMSSFQVEEIVGYPDSEVSDYRAGAEFRCAKYGRAWIVFRNESALCMRKRTEFRPGIGYCHCAGKASTFVWR